MCVKPSPSDVDRWFKIFTKTRWDLLNTLKKDIKSEHLACLVHDINIYIEEAGLKGNRQQITKLKNLLKSELARIKYPEDISLSELAPDSYNSQSKRTRMNTTLDRSPILDFPVQRYLKEHSFRTTPTIVDIGVGYPPLTTQQTAKVFSNSAKIIGIDTTVPDVCVEFPASDSHKYLVFFEYKESKQKFEPMYLFSNSEPSAEIIQYHVLKGDEKEFVLRKGDELRRELMSGLGEEHYAEMSLKFRKLEDQALLSRFCSHANVTQNGAILDFQPMRKLSLQQLNLSFYKDDFRLQNINKAHVIRLGNVLLKCYYTQAEAKKAVRTLAQKLHDGGALIICSGDDHSLTFEKREDSLVLTRATVMLRNNHAIFDSEIEYPGTKGLQLDIHKSVSGISRENQSASGEPMNRTSANEVKRNFANNGYDSVLTFEPHATFIEVALPGTRGKAKT